MSSLTREELACLTLAEAHAFDLIEKAAIAGERCPMSKPHGPLNRKAVATLRRLGFISCEVFGHNFRRAKILVGPNLGRQTAAHPGGGRSRSPEQPRYHRVAP